MEVNNMAVSIPEKCIKELDTFFANKTIHDVNRDSYLVCNLHDYLNKVIISMIFLRDWDSLESDSFNQVIIEGKGVVFTFPCYWISVPKELCMEYFNYIIKTFYEEYVNNWVSGSNDSNTSGSIGNGGNISNGIPGCGCTNSGFISPYPPCNTI